MRDFLCGELGVGMREQSVKAAIAILTPLMLPLPFLRLTRALRQSFSAYGLHFYQILFEEMRNGEWIDVAKAFIKNK